MCGLGRLGGPWRHSLLPEGSPLPCPPEMPFPPATAEQLNPATPSVYLNNRKDAMSPELARYCLTQPVVVIRGLAAALKLDLALFSTKTLVETSPEQRIEVILLLNGDIYSDSKGCGQKNSPVGYVNNLHVRRQIIGRKNVNLYRLTLVEQRDTASWVSSSTANIL